MSKRPSVLYFPNSTLSSRVKGHKGSPVLPRLLPSIVMGSLLQRAHFESLRAAEAKNSATINQLKSAALAPRKEVPALIPGTSSRPADVYLPNWRRGQPAALDVTVISTLQQLTLEGAASTQGHALSVGKERKMTAHSEACRSVGVIFLPLVVESLGGWDGEAADIIRAIGRLQGQRLGIPHAEATRHFFQRLAVSLWRGNAALWIGRLPTRSPELDGII